jgi:alcohol dehydrogenase (cytochrome c)
VVVRAACRARCAAGESRYRVLLAPAVYLRKATGGVPDLSWGEVIKGTWPGRQLKGTWPGSGFITGKVVTEGRSLSAAVVNPLDSPDDHAKGKELFFHNCAACHGSDGKGGHAPSLAKANYSVGASDLALYKVLRDGIPGTAMAGFDFSIEERWQLVGFLRSLDQRTGRRPRALDRTHPSTSAGRPC